MKVEEGEMLNIDTFLNNSLSLIAINPEVAMQMFSKRFQKHRKVQEQRRKLRGY